MITVVANLLAATVVVAQTPAQDERKKKNAIGLTVGLNEFFDGNPLWQARFPGTMRWVNLTYGLEYDRKLNDRHGFVAASKVTVIHYFSSDLEYGQTSSRSNLTFEAYYQRKLWASRTSSLIAFLGANFRWGSETVHLYSFGTEPILLDYDLKDPGLLAGLRGTKEIFWNLMVSGELRFTEYVYRYAAHQWHYPDEFPNRPTRHLLSLQLGLAYRF